MFHWIHTPFGRAAFSGSTRTREEEGCDTYRVEISGLISYGEIAASYPVEKSNVYDLVIKSIGFGRPGLVGSPLPQFRRVFTQEEAARIVGAIEVLVRTDLERPFPFDDIGNFSQKLTFSEGWIRIE